MAGFEKFWKGLKMEGSGCLQKVPEVPGL